MLDDASNFYGYITIKERIFFLTKPFCNIRPERVCCDNVHMK